ncbi:hypothetical protein NKF06_12825 [Haloferax sp. AB510]|uniref:hypothetical protein n=1 Tax=Haloferax sp. AB510 TaxID=2934172 RepID=UPI00209C0E96|nr:hypothetical protein [Haloferax sp. AB510]MCO8267447.1 hypothetical protein [Haloferax sp. AB510]
MTTPQFEERYLNPNATLPYGVTPDDVADAIKEWYDLYHGINEFLHSEGHHNIENLLRANNALSDFVGDILTDNLAEASDVLIKNQKQDGFPDILPIDNEAYAADDYRVHHGDEGIETKCSQQNGGWQAHNNESAWFVIFRYAPIDREVDPAEMAGVEIIQVLCAKLEEEDWSHSGRSGDSRRTITSSIIANGMDKLRSNPVYQKPEAITGLAEPKQRYREYQTTFDPVFAEEHPEYVTEQTELDV